MIRRLYRTPIPESAYRDSGETQRTQLAKVAALSGNGSVQSTGTSPGELTLNVQYRGKYAGRLALELSELLHSDAFNGLPYAPTEGSAEDDGYYSAESVSPGRIRPQTDRAVDVDATLARDGTRGDMLQGVETAKGAKENDFGSDQTTHIAIPASASMVRWWDGIAGVEWPSPVETRSAEFGDLELYSVDDSSFSDPTLLYKPESYDAIGDVDVGVWDTYGADSKRDQEDVVQWQRVFSAQHDPRGAMVLENGLLRLTLDDQAETIEAERWSAGSWTTESLAGDWAPLDVDVRTIAPARLEARILWSDGSERYPLDLLLARGMEDALWVRTPNAQSPTPTGLVDQLEPIASETIYDAGGQQGLVKREEVSA